MITSYRYNYTYLLRVPGRLSNRGEEIPNQDQGAEENIDKYKAVSVLFGIRQSVVGKERWKTN
jgi:hypothetical protein